MTTDTLDTATEKVFPRGYENEQDHHLPLATTTWTDDADVIDNYGEEERGVNPFLFGMYEGADGQKSYLSYHDDAGIFTVAGSRAGKGVSLIIPNLLSYEGAVVVLDPKGENTKYTARFRRDKLKQNLVVLDPFNETDFQTATFNPLAFFDADHDEFIDDITDLADALIVKGNASADPHWDESARSVFKMLLMYIVIDHEPEYRNLVWLRTLLLVGQSKSEKRNYRAPKPTFTEEMSEEEKAEEQRRVNNEIRADQKSSFKQLLKNFAEHDNYIIAGTAQRLLSAGDREQGSIISTAQRHTDFLDSNCIQKVLRTNSFDLNMLRQSSVYLVLPEKRMASQSRWLRLVITLILRHVQTDGLQDNYKSSIMMVLDECASLGYMETIERSMAYIAGFGVKMHTIWQDLNQLKSLYKERWETFIGNASIFTAFGNTDLTTLKYISERLGKCEVPRVDVSLTEGTSESDNRTRLSHGKDNMIEALDGGGSTGESYSKNLRPTTVISPLMLPEEVSYYFGKKTERILVLISGERPIYANRIIYYEDEPFKSRAK